MSDVQDMDEQDVLARTAWGEARGIGRDGMQATINVAQNRLASGVLWWGGSLRSICLYPYQFSCWNAKDPNRPKLLSVKPDDPQYTTALDLAAKAMAGELPDITCGATHYYVSTTRPKPDWAEGINTLAIIGPHWYFKAA